MGGGRAGFGRAQKCRSQLRGSGSSRQHRGHSRAGADPTGADQRQVDLRGQELQKSQQSVVLTVVPVDKGPAVAPGLDALGNQDVRAGGCGVGRLERVGHRHPDFRSGPMQALDDGGIRAAERERDDGHPFGDGQVEFGRERVVVVARLTQHDSKPIGFRGDLGQVVGEDIGVDNGVRDEDVESVRRVGEPP